MLKILKVLLLLTILILPLLSPVRFLGYEQVKVVFLITMLSLTGVVWLFLISQKKAFISKSLITKTIIIFLAILLLTSLLGLEPARSLLGRAPYLQGFILYFYLFLLYLFVSSSKLSIKDVGISLTISAFLVSAVATTQWVRLNIFGIPIPTYAGRVVSTFGQPNLYSSFLLLTLPFQFFLLKKVTNLKRILVSLALITSVISIYLSQSRAAIILTLILLVISLLTTLGVHKKTTKALSFSLILVVILVLAFLGKNLINEEFAKPLKSDFLIENSPEKRIFLWPVFLQIIKEEPFLGYGLENIPPAFSGFFAHINFNTLNNPSYHSLKNISVDRSHNLFLDLLIFSGISGLLVFIALFLISFKSSKNWTLRTILIIYLLWVQLQPQGIVQLSLFWVTLGLIDNES